MGIYELGSRRYSPPGMSVLRLVLETVRWLSGFIVLWSVEGCRPAAHDDEPPTVVTPARNEETNLPRLLASLPADVAVIVVDDHSDDRTAGVAADAGALVVTAPALATGANGKAAACAEGARTAIAGGADRLLFLDADCVVRPGGFDRLLGEHTAVGGL